MFSMTTNMPTVATRAPTSLRVSQSAVSAPTLAPSKLIPTQLPSAQPTLAPTLAPSASPSVAPSLQPSMQPSLTPTNSPMAAVGASSINRASSSSQSQFSTAAVGATVGCIIVVIIIAGACVFFTRKSKGKMTPYEIWSSHYSNKNQQSPIQPQTQMNEDIHHFYHKAPRPSINQNTVFTPHVSGRTSFRNSQIVTHVGPQNNFKRPSLAITTRNSQPSYPL
jgi:hypothetical protein